LVVEVGDPPSQPVDLVDSESARGQSGAEQGIGRKLAHLDGMVDDRPFAIPGCPEARIVAAAADRHDVEIEAWCQPSVQSKLVPADLLAHLRGAEVQEGESDRLLEFP